MALLDAFGRPIVTARLTEPQVAVGTSSMRQIWGGSAATGLTPARLAAILRACDLGEIEQFLILAEEMEERDPHYLSVLGTRKRTISSLTPHVEAAGEDARSVEIATFVEEHVTRHEGFARLVEDLLDALGKSFSVVEILWQRDGRRWWPASFLHHDPRFFRFDRLTGRDLRLREAGAGPDGMPLEPGHFITHRAQIKAGLTYRGGLARIAAFTWMCKAYTTKDWMAFIETYGLPIRLGKYDGKPTPEDVAKLYQAVASIGTDAAAVIPKSMEITFERGTTVGGDIVFERFARWADEQLSKAVLGQTMTADSGSSEAQARVHNDVRLDIAQSDARAVAATLNRDLVRILVDANFGVQPSYPRLILDVPEPEDLKLIVDSAVQLMDRGLTVSAAEMRGKLGLSEPKPGEEVIGGRAAAPAPAVPGQPPAPAPRVALNRADDSDGAAIEALVEEMLADWEEIADDLLGPIEAAIDAAESYGDLQRRLAGVAKDQKTGRLIDTLVKGLFKARALGDATDD